MSEHMSEHRDETTSESSSGTAGETASETGLPGLPMVDLLLSVASAQTAEELDAIDAELDKRLG